MIETKLGKAYPVALIDDVRIAFNPTGFAFYTWDQNSDPRWSINLPLLPGNTFTYLIHNPGKGISRIRLFEAAYGPNKAEVDFNNKVLNNRLERIQELLNGFDDHLGQTISANKEMVKFTPSRTLDNWDKRNP